MRSQSVQLTRLFPLNHPEAGLSTGFRWHAVRTGGRRFDPVTAHLPNGGGRQTALPIACSTDASG